MDIDEDDVYIPVDPGLDSDAAALEKSRINLRSYIDSVPYDCESTEDMHIKLEGIVGKIVICAKARNFLVLANYDGLLQCWLLMKYPLPKPTRSKLVSLYYQLCLLPGIEARVVKSWSNMLVLLLGKSGNKHKLESNDLQLDWKDLWKVMEKEIRPKKRLRDDSRNIINIMLYIAEQCKIYYPATAIPEMLETFLPLLTQESLLTMIPVITSFLPLTHPHLYLPALFEIWSALNSSTLDDRMIDLVGNLAEAQMNNADTHDPIIWRVVGMWTEAEWSFLVSKSLASMNIPIGASSRNSTSNHADSMTTGAPLKIKKSTNRINAIAKIIVYSISVDSPVRKPAVPGKHEQQEQEAQYPAGSRALDSLERMIVSTETYFHPSNSGPWTLNLTTLVQRLMAEFAKRWKEEEEETCRTLPERRLTPEIRREFIAILRTPALLAMFSKDPISAAYAQSTLRVMSVLEPSMIMPELIDRCYSGLESINETHRTTTVLSLLSSIAQPLVSEKMWFEGQKHVVPLLELALPGIDLNDPLKTIVSCMFVVSVVQQIRIGDLSVYQSALSGDAPGETMNVDDIVFPSGTESGEGPTLSREEERSLVRDSTAGFADWVTALWRRIFALYENLPDEGGRKNSTGGKQEETVIRSVKSVLDVVSVHLSDELFDLVLDITYNYSTSNARANSVRTFGSLVASLARARPEITIAKASFLPVCISRIRDELANGASSVRSTSSNTAAIPSDTTLHWYIGILRGCLGYGGPALLKHKTAILDILKLLIESTRTERGYQGAGRVLTRIFHTLTQVYPINPQFVNTAEWKSPEFEKDHASQWGRMYEARDCKIEWHVPSAQEIEFAMEILDVIISPCLDRVESLLETAHWDNTSRNDFCRNLSAVRSAWNGMPTILQEGDKHVETPCLNEATESDDLLVQSLSVEAGFILTDPTEARYQTVSAHRQRFGAILNRAALLLRVESVGEDHIESDAVGAVIRGIDVYLLEHAAVRSTYDQIQKAYTSSRDLHRIYRHQKENPRHVLIKRAQAYASGRLYLHSIYRRRSAMDDKLISHLVGFSLSLYTKTRRHAQSVFHNVSGYYVRTGRFALPAFFKALEKGNEPDILKGALHSLGNKGLASYALADSNFHSQYLMSLLGMQHEEKNSVQTLVSNLAKDSLAHLCEETVHTDAYSIPTPGLDKAVHNLELEFSSNLVDSVLLQDALKKTEVRGRTRNSHNLETIQSILKVAIDKDTHWKYQHMALRFLHALLRRDSPISEDLADFFMTSTLSPHPSIRTSAQRAVEKLAVFHKIRTYAASTEELWLNTWKSPSSTEVIVPRSASISEYFDSLAQRPEYFDKIDTGFIVFAAKLKGYISDTKPFNYSEPSLKIIHTRMVAEDYFTRLLALWSEESVRGGSVELRSENVSFLKSLTKMFENELDSLLSAIDPYLMDGDKYKQRAGAEALAGLLRGIKHWSNASSEKIRIWLMGPRLDRAFSQIKPDTLGLWEMFFSYVLQERDPSRPSVKSLIDYIMGLPLDFDGDSAFEMSKALSLFGTLLESVGDRLNGDRYMSLFIKHSNTSYAEIRGLMAQNMYTLTRLKWAPLYSSTAAFLQACEGNNPDPLRIREAPYLPNISAILKQFPQWKLERLPPPRVSQSQYDMTGLTLLQWIWITAHGIQARLIFPYIGEMMPEIIRMSEEKDSEDLSTYSTAVLYILSAVSPPPEYVDVVLNHFVDAIQSSDSWRIRLHALPALVVFFYRNLLTISSNGSEKVMTVLLLCLADENVEVREMAGKVLSGVVRSQRHSIIPLKKRFVALAKKTTLPPRRDPAYADSLRQLHSAVLGIKALIESFPYSVQPWIPPLFDTLAEHAADPTPISTTIRACASEFKKTHQDTWHTDQHIFDEEQLQSLSSILVGTSYYA